MNFINYFTLFLETGVTVGKCLDSLMYFVYFIGYFPTIFFIILGVYIVIPENLL